MPARNSQTPPPALFPFYPQNVYKLFDGEAVTTGEYSQQLAVPPGPVGSSPVTLRFTIDFSAAPGAFEIWIMESDNDAGGTGEYAQIPVAGVITAVNSGSTTQATVDLSPFIGSFLCLYVKTQPANAVNVTARVARR